ncbi:MAG: hypothetical protein LAP87_08675 [Acidobacteriia bacterium]|nr:hypothetical protein [Terriglobia bacterium]
MTAPAILYATLRFVCWEAALLAAAIWLAGAVGRKRARRAEEECLVVLGIQVALESSLAALFSFTGANWVGAYWGAAAVCALAAILAPDGRRALARFPGVIGRLEIFRYPRAAALAAGLLAPLVLLSFRPVEEIDSINYLHYLIDWMANRATPYTFASNYVAFWELSFLPSWMVTGVDLFFPLLALKAVVLLALAAWLVGRELGLRGGLLLSAVAGSMTLRHLWYEYSGVPTLKNDALHGAGFVVLVLVVLRARRRRRRLRPDVDVTLAALGAALVAVKYTGLFVVGLALVALLANRTRAGLRAWVGAAAFFLLTSGHYYVRALVLHGNPFYPFQINFGPVHLPGTADLSGTSILYSLHDARLWRAFFWPGGGVSPAGLLFPLTLAAALLVGTWRALVAHDWAAWALLAGWLLYFRSVYSASAYPGDLAFVLNSLNSIRYVDGVLAVSELFLVALLAKRFPRTAAALVAVNLASRLMMLYGHVPRDLFPPAAVCAVAALAFLLFLSLVRLQRTACAAAAALCLVLGGPFVVERNRALWTTYWNEVKPALARVRGGALAELALPEAGYFAGHVVAAGNPVRTEVRSLLPEEIAALPAGARPRFLAVLPTPVANDWRFRHRGDLAAWGYQPVVESRGAALFERTDRIK